MPRHRRRPSQVPTRCRTVAWPILRLLAVTLASMVFPPAARAEVGDVVGLSVSNGWLYVRLAGLNTNGTYQFGLSDPGTFRIPTHPTVVLRCLSPGFTTTGEPTTLSRTNFATTAVRRTYPNAQRKEEVWDGSQLTVRLALMDYTYRGDTETVATIAPGFYVQGGHASRGVTDMPVTNASTYDYPKPVANWSRPPWDLMSGDDTVLGVTGFGHHADEGRPLQCVRFWAVDRLGNATPVVTASIPEIDAGYGDALPVIEYLGRLDLRGLSTGLATAHFRAYPRLGDAGAVLDTSDGRFTFPSHEAAPTEFFADPQGTYGRTIAVVAVGGDNATARAVDVRQFDPQAPPPAFADLASAVTAVAETNGWLRGRRDPGGGIVYLRGGSYAWTGGMLGAFEVPSTWVTVRSFPGETAIFSGAWGSRHVGALTKVEGVQFSSASAATLDDMKGLWIGRGTRITNTTDRRFVDSVTNIWITGATIDSLPQGTRPAFLNYDSQFRLLRGCRIAMPGQYLIPTIVLGNLRYGGAEGAVKIQASGLESGTAIEAPSFPIIAFNAFYAENSPLGGHLLELWMPKSRFRNTNGFAVVQNLVEQVSSSTAASRTMSIASSIMAQPDTHPSPFAILWHNTVLGQRANLLENAGGETPEAWLDADRRLASFHNNLFEQPNTKDDRNYVPSTNGTRIGAFGFQHGINAAGNVDLDPVGMDNGFWYWSFFGISSFSTSNSPSPAILEWPKFARRRAGRSDNGPTAEGFGDYRLRPSSPAAHLAYRFVLPYDLHGRPRSPGGASGAFEVSPLDTVVSVEAPGPAAPSALEANTFLFTREGPLDLELDVPFSVGGTATEGSDFEPLGRSVRFPAGKATTTLVVIPTAEIRPDSGKTVSVRLIHDPASIAGDPIEATLPLTAAEGPRGDLRLILLDARTLRISATTRIGKPLVLESSENLTHWTPSEIVPVGQPLVLDVAPPENSARFYRLTAVEDAAADLR